MSSENEPKAITPRGPHSMQGGFPAPTPQEEWNALGTAFEGLCKVGLALTVGFSVAAAFCRVMENNKLKVPRQVTDMAQQILLSNMREAPPDKPASEA
ncbi:MAG: hypothetical protein ACYCW6_04465 [Candidatus Xenobia bacterium]